MHKMIQLTESALTADLPPDARMHAYKYVDELIQFVMKTAIETRHTTNIPEILTQFERRAAETAESIYNLGLAEGIADIGRLALFAERTHNTLLTLVDGDRLIMRALPIDKINDTVQASERLLIADLLANFRQLIAIERAGLHSIETGDVPGAEKLALEAREIFAYLEMRLDLYSRLESQSQSNAGVM